MDIFYTYFITLPVSLLALNLISAFINKMIVHQSQTMNGSDSFSIEKDKDAKQVRIKMAARQIEAVHYVEDFLRHEIELAQSHSMDGPNKQQKHHFSKGVSKGHLMMSSFVSFTILLHAIYWEYSARSMDGFHHKWSHFQVSLAFSILNLLPSLSIWLNIYSSFVSIAVIIHSIWLIYHIFASWVYDICSYNTLTEMCISVIMYKNVTLCLVAIVIFHQWLILLANFRKYNNVNHPENKVQQALENAENLDLEEIQDVAGMEPTEMVQVTDDLETEAIDISLETPTEADVDQHKLDLDELEARYKYFKDHSHKENGCKYCFWIENPSLSIDNPSIQITSKHRNSGWWFKVIVPKSTKNMQFL